jgi:hypothetical protein
LHPGKHNIDQPPYYFLEYSIVLDYSFRRNILSRIL